MAQVFNNDGERDAFLAEPRLAILMTNRPDRSPLGVPVWFDWDGAHVWMFSSKNAPKIKRLQQDPQATVLVTNRVGEDEAWVSFEGNVDICEDQAAWPLVEKVAPKYWDLEAKAETWAAWQSAQDMFVLLRLTPDRIRSGQ